MSELPESLNDVFLSYSWKDNKRSAGEIPDGWVDRFFSAFVEEVKELWRETLIPFRDNERISADRFDDVLKLEVRRSLLMLCVLSPEYLRSGYCPFELREFDDWLQAEPLLSDPGQARARLIPVIRMPLGDRPSEELLPREMKGLKFVEFFRRTGKGASDWDIVEPGDPEWRAKVRETARMARTGLGRIYGQGGPLYGRRGTVYLASTTEDLDTSRTSIAIDLDYAGFATVPERVEDILGNALALPDRVRPLVGRSRLALHAFGSKRLGGSANPPIHHEEYRLVMDACRLDDSPLEKVFVWIPRDFAPADDAMKKFVEDLEDDPGMPRQVEVIRDTFPELKSALRDKLKRLSFKPVSGSAPARTTTPVRKIYFVYQLSDRANAHFKPLRNWLQSLPDCEVLLPELEGSAESIRERDTGNRRDADVIVVFCAPGSRARVEELERILTPWPRSAGGLVWYVAPTQEVWFDDWNPLRGVKVTTSGDFGDGASEGPIKKAIKGGES